MKLKNSKRIGALVLGSVLVLQTCLSSVQLGTAKTDSGFSYHKIDRSEFLGSTLNKDNKVESKNETTSYADTDEVRVLIVLEEEGAITLADSPEAVTDASVKEYKEELVTAQTLLQSQIEEEVLDGEELDVVWNLTYVANAISANILYGQIGDISEMEGVKSVILETKYQPLTSVDTNNIVAQNMTGTNAFKNESGYYGAGSRVAIVDTGTDTDHQSFSQGAYEYALKKEAEAKGISYEEYVASLNLLTVEEIDEVLEELNCYSRYYGLTAEDLYLSEKQPFGFNYVDWSLDVTHDNDDQGEHGSHVAGITTANTYIPCDNLFDFDGDGDFDRDDAQTLMDYAILGSAIENVEFSDLNGDGKTTAYDVYVLLTYLEEGYITAENTVGVTGVAPDAQLITMKVFGAMGGAYTSDYMAAVEDAVLLKCDAVNLSLGSAYPGFGTYHGETAEETAFVDGIMESLEETGIVMCVAAGNSGNWADSDDAFGLMYSDEGGTFNVSDPGTFYNAFGVASVDNIGGITTSKTVVTTPDGSEEIVLSVEEVSGAETKEWRSLDTLGGGTAYEVVFLGDPSALFAGEEQTDLSIYGGSVEDFAGYDFTGKIVMIARGNGVYFSAKHNNAGLAGAAGVIIYNNVPGTLSASIAGSEATIPCGGLTFDMAKKIFSMTSVETGAATAKMTVTRKMNVNKGEDVLYPTMSSFSSWGPTSALTLKPEITAPGGGIYSVNGAKKETDAYEVMSGTSMATPHVSGLVALAAQYLKANGVLEIAKEVSGLEGLTNRQLIQSLMMSTALPLIEEASGVEYSVRNQGAGLANIEKITSAESFVMVEGQTDGKVKAELGDGTEDWTFTFTLYNLTDTSMKYDLSASILTSGTAYYNMDGTDLFFTTDELVELGAVVTYTGENVTEESVTLAAKSSSDVTVSIHVPEESVAAMKELGHVNGFYVEGFVYATPESGVTHSIPVLAWYGNWTDISMFDTGSTLDMIYGTQTRPSHVNALAKNFLGWAPKGSDSVYTYTGNIYGGYNESVGLLGDQRYIPARNAFNTTENRQIDISAIFPTLIRPSLGVRTMVTDVNTGEVYFVDTFDEWDTSLIPCFYYPNEGAMYDITTDYGIGFDWDYTDSEGNPLPEGTRVSFSLTLAPEYYALPEGGFDWDALGKGATLSFDFTVDNTAPDLSEVEVPMSVEMDGETPSKLNFTVEDNNYIAAVILLNGSGTKAFDYFYPDMDEDKAGTSVSGSFDLAEYMEVYGTKAAIAICDYAGNETYYAINLGGEGASYGEFVAYQFDSEGSANSWVSFDADVNLDETALFTSGVEFKAAEYVNGYVFAQAENADLYAFPYEELLKNELDFKSTKVARLNNSYVDFAYNYATGKLMGLNILEDAWGNVTTEVYSINIDDTNGEEPYYEEWTMGRGGFVSLGLAADDAGTLYVMGIPQADEDFGEVQTDIAELWASEMEVSDWGYVSYGPFKKIGSTGLEMDYLQSMTWDHNTEKLYWSRFYPVSWMEMDSELIEVNPETAECTQVGTLTSETACLFAPLTAETQAMEAHSNVPYIDTTVIATPVVSVESLTVSLGASKVIELAFEPWYSAHKDVIWSSSDESIATVDANGVVTGVSAGKCTITVANAEDESCYDTVELIVSALTLSIDGVISSSGGGIGNVGGTVLYNYNMENGVGTMNFGNRITAPEELSGMGLQIATTTYGRDKIWACEYGNTGIIYQIGEDGVVEDYLEPIDGDMMFGLSYSEKMDSFTGIMNFYMYVDQPFTLEAQEEMINSYDEERNEFTWHKLDMSKYLNASDKNFATPEEGLTSVVFCGITNYENDGTEMHEVYQDFLGNWTMGGGAVYMQDVTWVLLDNVGRLWYVDEITGMTFSEMDGMYFRESDYSMVDPSLNGVEAVEYVDEEGNVTYNVFVIRELEETPLHAMYLSGDVSYTYHFSSLYRTEDEAGNDLYFISLYDYWHEGTTNDLYLYVPSNEMILNTETWGYEKAPGTLYELGDTGFGNMIATIHKAEVIDGLEMPEAEPYRTANKANVYGRNR